LQDKELVAKLVSLAVAMLLPAHRCNQTNARNGKAHYNNAEVNATAHPLQTRCVLPYTVNANSMLIFNWNQHDTLPRNDQSPPDRKRPRRSPLSSEQGPPMGSANYPPQGQQPGGGQGGPQQLQNGMMRPMNAPGLNGFPQAGVQMGNNSGMNMQMGGQPMGGPQMSPQAMPMQQQQQQVSSRKCHA
jgi:hypothetical protein